MCLSERRLAFPFRTREIKHAGAAVRFARSSDCALRHLGTIVRGLSCSSRCRVGDPSTVQTGASLKPESLDLLSEPRQAAEFFRLINSKMWIPRGFAKNRMARSVHARTGRMRRTTGAAGESARRPTRERRYGNDAGKQHCQERNRQKFSRDSHHSNDR